MDRTVDPQVLAIALGEHEPGILPTPDELATLIAQVEVRAIRAQFGLSDELLATAWYLHGITAAAESTALYDPERRRHAFAVSAHILDLALDDPQIRLDDEDQEQGDNSTGSQSSDDSGDEAAGQPVDPQAVRARRLSIAFGAQIGYRRCEQDPNASAIFRKVTDLLIVDEPLASHAETLAVEAGVVFLSMQRRRLTATLRIWRRQLRRLQTLADVPDLRGTLYGSAQGVIEAVYQLTVYLTRSDPAALEQAETHLRDVATGRAGPGDRSARWVAAHLLELLGELVGGSLQRLLPPDTPPALAQAFALSDPPVMTLWPPQRELLQQAAPLDPDKKRLLISVPTSAGKTLMAQLVICAHLAADTGRVLYVSPLCSLGREMRQALRSRLRVLGSKLGDDLPKVFSKQLHASAHPSRAHPPGSRRSKPALNLPGSCNLDNSPTSNRACSRLTPSPSAITCRCEKLNSPSHKPQSQRRVIQLAKQQRMRRPRTCIELRTRPKTAPPNSASSTAPTLDALNSGNRPGHQTTITTSTINLTTRHHYSPRRRHLPHTQG